MKTRNLGQLSVAPIGLGCMSMSFAYGPRDDDESIRTIHAALDHGVTMLDTADRYGGGHNEELIARALHNRRHETVIATKFGNIKGDDGGPDVCGKPEYVRRACDASLSRLGSEVIDLYYIHRIDPSVPIEETVGAMAGLVKQGKVRFLGLSEAGAETVRRAHATHPIAALQMEYSLWTRDIENGIQDLCRELGIGLVAYAPLGRGFLTGKILDRSELAPDDVRNTYPRFAEKNLPRNAELLKMLQLLAEERNATQAQIALAWVLCKGDDIVPIPGTKRTDRLLENIKASEISLSDEEMNLLNAAFAPDAPIGDRYPEKDMARLGK